MLMMLFMNAMEKKWWEKGKQTSQFLKQDILSECMELQKIVVSFQFSCFQATL